MKFKVGHRVACYWSSEQLIRSLGTVESIDYDGTLKVVMDIDEEYFDGETAIGWNPKQCRKVIKKCNRTIWATIEPDGTLSRCRIDKPVDATWSLPWIEFKEVKKKV